MSHLAGILDSSISGFLQACNTIHYPSLLQGHLTTLRQLLDNAEDSSVVDALDSGTVQTVNEEDYNCRLCSRNKRNINNIACIANVLFRYMNQTHYYLFVIRQPFRGIGEFLLLLYELGGATVYVVYTSVHSMQYTPLARDSACLHKHSL